jgi:hypothetical protein
VCVWLIDSVCVYLQCIILNDVNKVAERVVEQIVTPRNSLLTEAKLYVICFIILNVLFSWLHSFLWFWCPEFQLLLSLNVLNCDIDNVYFTFSHHFESDVSFGIIKHLLTRYSGNTTFIKLLTFHAIDSDIKALNREGDRLNYHPLPCDRLNWHTVINQWEDRKFTWSIVIPNGINILVILSV